MHRENDSHLIWKEISREEIADCKVFKVFKALRETPGGEKVNVAVIDAPAWVCVVPLVLREGREHCLMVKQFRQGSQTVTWEFPAGTGEPGESPEDAAERELLEETGAVPGKLTLIGQVNPNPAFMTNTQYFYAAEDLEFSGRQNLDEHEEVEYFLVPLEEIKQKMGCPPFDNGTMMNGLAFFLRWRGEF